MILFAIIWIVSSILGYLMLRYDIRRSWSRWTVDDRKFAITLSLIAGPLMLIVGAAKLLFTQYSDEEASW